ASPWLLLLKNRRVHRWTLVLIKTLGFHVAGHADDRQPLRWRLPREADATADGVRSRPVLPGHALVDDRDQRRIIAIAGQEGAAFQQRNLQRVEVIRAHQAGAGIGFAADR